MDAKAKEGVETHESIKLEAEEAYQGDYNAYLQRQEGYLQTRANNFLAVHPNLVVQERELYRKDGSLFLRVHYLPKKSSNA